MYNIIFVNIMIGNTHIIPKQQHYSSTIEYTGILCAVAMCYDKKYSSINPWWKYLLPIHNIE